MWFAFIANVSFLAFGPWKDHSEMLAKGRSDGMHFPIGFARAETANTDFEHLIALSPPSHQQRINFRIVSPLSYARQEQKACCRGDLLGQHASHVLSSATRLSY